LADNREIDFLVARLPHAQGFIQVLTFNQIKPA
jgi:hypothetical protein